MYLYMCIYIHTCIYFLLAASGRKGVEDQGNEVNRWTAGPDLKTNCPYM